jgi:D-alanine--poly(phosphoribitol) ligase subunit 1
MDLIERIHHWGQVAARRAAHVAEGSVLTYGELAARSDALAAYLLEHLPADGSPVAILGHKQNEMLVGFVACVKAGHPYIPLDTSLPDHRVQAIMEAAGASLLLTCDKIAEICATTESSASIDLCQLERDDPWYIIFTSGSTGDPKGVVITRGCLESFVEWILAEQNFVELQEVFLNQAPFSFDLSVMDLYSSLATGGTLHSLTKDEMSDFKALYRSFEQSRLSVWVSTPSFARLCLMDPGFGEPMLPALRKFWFCGETLAPDVAAGLLKRFPKAEVWNTYGPTEATVATTSVQITAEVVAAYGALPVGRPKPGTTVAVHDQRGQAVPNGQRGEIIIAGPNVSLGYIRRPDLTERAFFELEGQRAYHTGDSGHYQDGMLFFDGRMDFQIKLHGYRIEIGDIEANLHALTNVQDAVVLPYLKQGQADHLVAFIIVKAKATSDFETMRQLKKELAERVPEYMIPRRFIFLPEFPATNNGKVDRRRLAEMLQ